MRTSISSASSRSRPRPSASAARAGRAARAARTPPVRRPRPPAPLRQRLPKPGRRATPGRRGHDARADRHADDRAQHRRRARCTAGVGDRRGRPAAALGRRAAALQPSSDPARGRAHRAAQDQGGECAHRRRRWARLAARALPRGRRHRPISAWSTSTSSTRATCNGRSSTARRASGAQARVRARAPQRSQSRHARRSLRDADHERECVRDHEALRPRRRRHRQLPDPLPRERRVRAPREAERLRQHLPLRGPGERVSTRAAARATAASIPIRRRPGWCRRAPRAACSACCRA